MVLGLNDLVSVVPVVDSASAPVSGAREAAALGGQSVAPGQNAPPTPAPDSAVISPLASLLGAVATKAAATSSFRPQLVQHLKDAIASGTYRPNLAEVANRVAAALAAGPS